MSNPGFDPRYLFKQNTVNGDMRKDTMKPRIIKNLF